MRLYHATTADRVRSIALHGLLTRDALARRLGADKVRYPGHTKRGVVYGTATYRDARDCWGHLDGDPVILCFEAPVLRRDRNFLDEPWLTDVWNGSYTKTTWGRNHRAARFEIAGSVPADRLRVHCETNRGGHAACVSLDEWLDRLDLASGRRRVA